MGERQAWEIDRCAICECDLEGGVYVAGVGTVCFDCDKREFGPFDDEVSDHG